MLQRFVDEGMAVLVGSVNAKGVPACCRAIALTSDDSLATLTVYVPMSTSHETLANVATTRRLAVVATHLIDHCSIQMKGKAGTARLAREDEAPLVRRRFDQFFDILNSIGIPYRVTRAVAWWPAFAIDMKVEEIYEQTPGPKAGTRVR